MVKIYLRIKHSSPEYPRETPAFVMKLLYLQLIGLCQCYEGFPICSVSSILTIEQVTREESIFSPQDMYKGLSEIWNILPYFELSTDQAYYLPMI